ncbi:hypothetical protein H4Q26_012054 [Puccinia striiformis f. sp. tritici PST-130]|nr:hypothetical protein H4Q26_012054 [Puccinia striiformis f. sp. tritici PST-130]
MPYRITQNPSPLIPSVPALDGNSVVFPAWRSRLEDVWVLDIVDGTIPRPKAKAEAKPVVRTEKGYNPEEFRSDWDTLSDIARSTIKLTLLVDLSIRYRDDSFWNAKHDPNAPIAKWMAKICDRLLRGIDESWKTIRDHLVYSPSEVSLDDAIGALEAHEVSTQVSDENFDPQRHHSSKCSNPSIKNKPGAQAKSTEARAGSVSFATLGNYNSEVEDNDDDSYDDDDCDVVWG